MPINDGKNRSKTKRIYDEPYDTKTEFYGKKKTMYAGEKGTERVQKLRTEYW